MQDPKNWTAIASCIFIWIGLALGVLGLGYQVLPAADTWWHLAAGDLILNTRALPTRDIYSFTAGDHPWLNHEWMTEILFAVVVRSGGLEALCGLKLALLTISAAILPAASLYRTTKQATWLVVIPFVLYCCQWSYFVDARAYLITYLGVSLTTFCLLEFQHTGRALWLAICPLFAIVWVNSHGGFILGPAIMGVFFLLSRKRRALGLSTGATLLAATLNPEGPAMLLFPFSLLKKDAFSVGLNEWARPDLLGKQAPYLFLVIGVLALALVNRKRINLPLFLSSLAFLLLGLLAWRHEPLAGLMLCYLLPTVLPPMQMNDLQAFAFSLIALTTAAWFLAQRRHLNARDMLGMSFFPSGAVQYMANHPELPPNFANPYGWGGFLLWRLPSRYKIFFDGRAHTVYPESVFRDGYYLQYGEPWKRLLASRGIAIPAQNREELLDTYQIDLVLTNKHQGDLAIALANNMTWAKIFEDHTSVLYLRREDAPTGP